MLFDPLLYLNELKLNRQDDDLYGRYNSQVQTVSLVHCVSDLAFYKEYLSLFPFIPFSIPFSNEEDSDWELFQRLVMASFSTEYEFIWPDNQDVPELVICSEGKDEERIKAEIRPRVSELFSFQLIRIHEIYFEEQMEFQILCATDEAERKSINCLRLERLEKARFWQREYDKLMALRTLR